MLDTVSILVQKIFQHCLEITEVGCCERVEPSQCFSLEVLEEEVYSKPIVMLIGQDVYGKSS